MSDDLKTTLSPAGLASQLEARGVLKRFGPVEEPFADTQKHVTRTVATEICAPEQATGKRTVAFDHSSTFPDTEALQKHLKDNGFQDGQLVKCTSTLEPITKPLHLKACMVRDGKIHLYMGHTIRVTGEHGKITITAA